MMRIENSLDDALRRYVLGELEGAARLALEQRVVIEPEVFDALSLMEDELVEAYADGRLSETERCGFERHFMASPDRRGQVALIRLLKQHAVESGDLEIAADAGFLHWAADRAKEYPLWAAAVAACLVALVGGNLWFAVSAIRLRRERDRVRAEQVSAERPPQSSSPPT